MRQQWPYGALYKPKGASRVRFRYILLAVLAVVAIFTHWDRDLREQFAKCDANPQCRCGEAGNGDGAEATMKKETP